jgi:hypothetical protein
VYLEKEVEEFLAKADKKKGWLTQYSRTHNYSSPFRIDEVSLTRKFSKGLATTSSPKGTVSLDFYFRIFIQSASPSSVYPASITSNFSKICEYITNQDAPLVSLTKKLLHRRFFSYFNEVLLNRSLHFKI